MSRSTSSVLLSALLASVGVAAHAADGPSVTISGYGTGALTMSDSDDAEFVRANQAAGATKTARTGVDSNFGIQATTKVNDWLSFTGQGLVRKITTDRYGAELAWAFAKMKASDELSIRVGRVGLPVYMISDYRNVGYANTMMRPPIEVYGQVPLDTLDGVDAVYQRSFGDTTLTAQFGVGRNSTSNVGGSQIVFSRITALNIVAENGPFTFRFGRADATFSLNDSATLDGLNGALRLYGFNSVADALTIHDSKGSFTSLGLGVDWNNIIVQSEYAKRKGDSRAIPDTSSWYAMFGYRIGKFTPYFNHATVTQDSARTFPFPPVPALAPLAAGANYASSAALQTTNALGLRWDFNKSAAFKVQVDRITPSDGQGAFVNPTPSFTGPVTVYAAGIDFVF
jgi:hypothetical protein